MSGITMVNSYRFPKLTKSNYGDWVANMGIRIRAANKDLWPYLSDKLLEDTKKDLTAITSEQKEDLSDLIYVMLSTEARDMLSKSTYEDGVELWNEIKEIFTGSRNLRYIRLQLQQQNLCYDQFQSIHQYKSAWHRLQNDIEDTGVKETADIKFYIHVLQMLPSERFAIFKQIFQSKDIQFPSSDKVIQMILDEENRLKQKERTGSTEGNTAYKLGSKKRNAIARKSYKSSANASVECYRCHRHGHYKRDCSKKDKE